jgi:hypothetical protein
MQQAGQGVQQWVPGLQAGQRVHLRVPQWV